MIYGYIPDFTAKVLLIDLKVILNVKAQRKQCFLRVFSAFLHKKD